MYSISGRLFCRESIIELVGFTFSKNNIQFTIVPYVKIGSKAVKRDCLEIRKSCPTVLMLWVFPPPLLLLVLLLTGNRFSRLQMVDLNNSGSYGPLSSGGRTIRS